MWFADCSCFKARNLIVDVKWIIFFLGGRVRKALPAGDLKFDPPCIPASKNWPKWLVGEESPSCSDASNLCNNVSQEIEEENEKELNVEVEGEKYECAQLEIDAEIEHSSMNVEENNNLEIEKPQENKNTDTCDSSTTHLNEVDEHEDESYFDFLPKDVDENFEWFFNF